MLSFGAHFPEFSNQYSGNFSSNVTVAVGTVKSWFAAFQKLLPVINMKLKALNTRL